MTETEPRVAYGFTGTLMHATTDQDAPAAAAVTTACGGQAIAGTGSFITAFGPYVVKCPVCAGYVNAEADDLDATMREQMTRDPEEGGPRDPKIGPHPRFAEMDARREDRLHGHRAPLVSTDAVRVAELPDRLVFTLTEHGVAQLARQLGTGPDEIRAAARRTGWEVAP